MAQAPLPNPLHVLHDAAVMARLAGAAPPPCRGLACRLGRPDEVLAAWLDANLLADDLLIDAELPGRHLIAWSGSLAADMEAEEPRNWMGPGAAALRERMAELEPQLAALGRSLLLRPHAAHVLSDVPSCLRWLERPGAALAFDPGALLTVPMLALAEEHLERSFRALAPRAAIVILEDVEAPGADPEAPFPRRCPLGRGRLASAGVAALVRRFVPPEVPIVLGPGAMDAQLAALGAAAG